MGREKEKEGKKAEKRNEESRETNKKMLDFINYIFKLF